MKENGGLDYRFEARVRGPAIPKLPVGDVLFMSLVIASTMLFRLRKGSEMRNMITKDPPLYLLGWGNVR